MVYVEFEARKNLTEYCKLELCRKDTGPTFTDSADLTGSETEIIEDCEKTLTE